MSNIEGIPEGWELVRVGKVKPGECWLDCDGVIIHRYQSFETEGRNYVIVQRVEKPKQYRAFANKAEYAPHRDRFIINRHCGNDDTCSSYRITDFNGEGVCFGGSRETYEDVFGCYVFDNLDGTTEPFGVEVTS